MNTEIDITTDESKLLYTDICGLIENTRQRVATTANADVCIMQWQIGKRIKEDVLYNKRAEYGKQIIQNLSAQLTVRFGKGWSIYKLQHCVRAAYIFSEDEIVNTNPYCDFNMILMINIINRNNNNNKIKV